MLIFRLSSRTSDFTGSTSCYCNRSAKESPFCWTPCYAKEPECQGRNQASLSWAVNGREGGRNILPCLCGIMDVLGRGISSSCCSPRALQGLNKEHTDGTGLIYRLASSVVCHRDKKTVYFYALLINVEYSKGFFFFLSLKYL